MGVDDGDSTCITPCDLSAVDRYTDNGIVAQGFFERHPACLCGLCAQTAYGMRRQRAGRCNQ